MKVRVMVITLALMGFSAASAQTPSVVIVPALTSIPIVARLATAKKLPMPECRGKIVVHKNNEIVCATPGIDWSAYGKVEVASVEVASMDTNRPLTQQEVAKLTNTLMESLQKRFGHSQGSSESGPMTRKLMLRATITKVHRTNKALNIVTLATIQSPVSFGGASTHFELSDGENGQVLAQIDLSGRGRQYDAFSSTRTLGHTQKALSRMPKRLDKDLKTLRSNSNPSNAVQSATLQASGNGE
jgi:hypothetical protein